MAKVYNEEKEEIISLTKDQFFALTGAKFSNAVEWENSATGIYSKELKKTPQWQKEVDRFVRLDPKAKKERRLSVLKKFNQYLIKSFGSEVNLNFSYYQVHHIMSQMLTPPEIFILFHEPILNHLSSDFFFAKEGKAGYGVGVLTEKKPGDFIGIFSGIVKPLDKMIRINRTRKILTFENPLDASYGRVIKGIRSFPFIEPYYFKKIAISAFKKRNLIGLINDSGPQQNNVSTITVLPPKGWLNVLLASKKIKARETLGWSYGQEYWIGKQQLPLDNVELTAIDFEDLYPNQRTEEMIADD